MPKRSRSEQELRDEWYRQHRQNRRSRSYYTYNGYATTDRFIGPRASGPNYNVRTRTPVVRRNGRYVTRGAVQMDWGSTRPNSLRYYVYDEY